MSTVRVLEGVRILPLDMIKRLSDQRVLAYLKKARAVRGTLEVGLYNCDCPDRASWGCTREQAQGQHLAKIKAFDWLVNRLLDEKSRRNL